MAENNLRYPVVLLDVGGTMIGSRASFGQVYSEVFSEFGVRCDGEHFNDAIYTAWNEMNAAVPQGVDRYAHFDGGEEGYWRRFIVRSVELATGEMVGDRLAAAALRRLQDRFGNAATWRVFEDVPPALQALRDLGARLAVVSNWDSQLPNVLRVLSLDGWFETVVVSRFEGVEKPNPRIFELALERMGIEPGQAVHVGDSRELDGVGAAAAGVDFAWVDRSEKPRDGSIPDFKRLPGIVERGF